MQNFKKHRWCWTARQYKNGWNLALWVGNVSYPIPYIRFFSPKEIKKVLKGNIVFVHKK